MPNCCCVYQRQLWQAASLQVDPTTMVGNGSRAPIETSRMKFRLVPLGGRSEYSHRRPIATDLEITIFGLSMEWAINL